MCRCEPSEGVLSVKRERSSRGEVITATVSYSGAVRRSVSQEVRRLAGQHGEGSGDLNCTGCRDGQRSPGISFWCPDWLGDRGLSPRHRVQLSAIYPMGR